MSPDHAAVMATIDTWIDRPALLAAARQAWEEEMAAWDDDAPTDGRGPDLAALRPHLVLDFHTLSLVPESIDYYEPLPNIRIMFDVEYHDPAEDAGRGDRVGWFSCVTALDGTILDTAFHLYRTIKDTIAFWYGQLGWAMKTPWTARCVAPRAISPLVAGEQVTVVGMAPPEECRYELFVIAQRADAAIVVPLAQLAFVEGTRKCRRELEIWRNYDTVHCLV